MLEKVRAVIAMAESKVTFMDRVARFLPRSDPRYSNIERAYTTAEMAFRQTIRENGEWYFVHLRSVALIVMEYLRIHDPVAIMAAILHDIIEDIDGWDYERVRFEFGEEVAYLVDYMTKPSPAEYPDSVERHVIYHARFELAPRLFFCLKFPDRLHNLLTLEHSDEEKRIRKIEETRVIYLPYAEREIVLVHELEEALDLAEQQLKAA